MKINSKVVLSTLAGLAVASGIGYYFYRRKTNSAEYLLGELRDLLFVKRSKDLKQIKEIFDKLYKVSVGKYLEEYQASSKEDKLKWVQTKAKEFFREVFYLLLDGQAEFEYANLMKGQSIKKMQTEEHFIQYNLLMNLILNQINEFINQHSSFNKIISIMFREGFDKSIRYLITTAGFEYSATKTENNSSGILEYLLVHQICLNSENQNSFDSLLEELCVGQNNDILFVQYLSEKYFKLIKFAIKISKVKNQKSGEEEDKSIYQLTRISDICIKALANESFGSKICCENESYILNIANLLKEQISVAKESSEVIRAYLFYIQLLFKSYQTIESFNSLDELLEILMDTQEVIFESMQIVNQSDHVVQYLKEHFDMLQCNIGIQKNMYDIFYNIATASCSGLSQKKKQVILKTLCTKYKAQIDLAYNKCRQNQEHNREDRNYVGFSIASLLLPLVIISQGPELSSDNVLATLEQNFQWISQEEFDVFIYKITYILHCNLLTYSFHYNGQALKLYTEQHSSTLESKNEVQSLWNQLLNSEVGAYDLNTLSFQLATSAQISTDQLIYKFVSHYHFQFRNVALYELVQIEKPQIVLKNIIYDQTPIINVDKKLNHIISKANQDIELKTPLVVKQTLDSIINLNPDCSKSFTQLEEKAYECISDMQLIKNMSEDYSARNEEEILSLATEALESSNLLNVGRYFNNQSEERGQNKFIVNKGEFKTLFKFQQELIINSFTSEYLIDLFLEKLRLCSINQDLCKDMLLSFDIYLLIWSELIQLLEEEPNLFNEDQRTLIEQLKCNLLEEYNFSFLNPQINHLVNSHIQKQQTIPVGAENMYQLFQKLAKNENEINAS